MRFKDIIGHSQAKQRLISMVASANLPHAILISGPEGIGKLMLARAFAQYLHCMSPTPDGDSCGKCPACIQHNQLNYPDLLFSFPIAGAKGKTSSVSQDWMIQWKDFLTKYPLAPYNKWLELLGNDNAQPSIKVEETKNIIHKMNLSNYSASSKIMIIWMPEKLQPEAANRLLKLIEEPEEGKLFIFISSHPAEILPTIYSRLQRINLHPLNSTEIENHLITAHGTPSNKAMEIAKMAAGNLALAENILAEDGEREEFLVEFTKLMRLAYSRKVGDLKKWSEDIAAFKREKSRRFLEYTAHMIRENFLLNLSQPNLVALSDKENEFSSRFFPFIHNGNVEIIQKEIDEASRDILRNGNAKIILFDFAVQMIIALRLPKT